MSAIAKLVEEYKEQLSIVDATIEEREEMQGEDFDPQDWSGGNFDDCYEMGLEDGENYGIRTTISDIIGDLEKLLVGEES